jgi:hypothetical protein
MVWLAVLVLRYRRPRRVRALKDLGEAFGLPLVDDYLFCRRGMECKSYDCEWISRCTAPPGIRDRRV